MKIPMIVALIIAGSSQLAAEAHAQGPLIELDAPERKIEGCYAVETTDGSTLFGFEPLLGPDTISLTLDADHGGTITTGVMRPGSDTIIPVPWRKAGWMLRVRPDPLGGIHSFPHWRMDEQNISVIGGDGDSFVITASPHGDAAWEGTMHRVLKGASGPPSHVRLIKTSCPSAEYFTSIVQRVWRQRSR